MKDHQGLWGEVTGLPPFRRWPLPLGPPPPKGPKPAAAPTQGSPFGRASPAAHNESTPSSFFLPPPLGNCPSLAITLLLSIQFVTSPARSSHFCSVRFFTIFWDYKFRRTLWANLISFDLHFWGALSLSSVPSKFLILGSCQPAVYSLICRMATSHRSAGAHPHPTR